MIPFRFGADREQLFGVLHPAQRDGSGLGVLLCPPFGQEAIRLHRFYRVLADRLARNGTPVLRFDPFGTGDSDGDDLDGDLLRWQADIRHADAQLRERAGCRRVAWIGARLGGTLAAMAHRETHGAVRPDALILWEPIVDGPAYLRQLARDHVQALESPYRAHVQPAGALPAGEALGFGMSDALIAQIGAIQGLAPVAAGTRATPDGPGHTRLTVIAPADAAASHRAWMAAFHGTGAADFMPLSVAFDWTSEEALNTALVPQAALQALLKTVEGTAA